MEINLKTERVYSIRELNSEIRGILNREFPEFVWVHGEIQDYDKNKHKQNIYFKLCEKHPEVNEIIAQVSAVIFENRKPIITKILKQAENQLELKDDLEVKLLCKIDFFSKSGKLILIVEEIDPVYTLGRLAQTRQRIIEELKIKGLLDKNKKLMLAAVPLNIGLITSYNSAAYNDFLDELKRSGFGFKIYFFNSSMQGKNVEPDVCRALEIFDRIQFLDLVVITRGGGSTADLSWFDNKIIAQTIANFRLPVLTGIGHEINRTITDLVAHTYAKTPTAIAQFIVERVKNFIDTLNEEADSIIRQVDKILTKEKQRIENIARIFDSETHKFLRIHHEEIASLIKEIKISPINLMHNLKSDLQSKLKEVSTYTQYYLLNAKRKIENIKNEIKIDRFRKNF
ncbi:MAG: exodeoxyribonuclease VII large subunit, partial [Candidatus Omnitrophica bacterium]|nr:exodeoxyribonuclease VII large subunit [Candidatus Omnitrophota bacterium]